MSDSILSWFQGAYDETVDKAIAAMEESVVEAAETQRAFLDAEPSYTKTGIERVASGRGAHAGRWRSGDMIAAVDGRVEVESEPGRTVITGIVGWPTPDQVVIAQEEGTDRIKAAHSLAVAKRTLDENLTARVAKIARGGAA